MAGRRKSPASLGSNWKRDELSAISRPLPHSLWKHAQARSETGLATWLCFQVRTNVKRRRTPVDTSGRRKWSCCGASPGMFSLARVAARGTVFQDSDPFDLLAPQTMPQDAQQPLPVSQNAAQQRQLRLQSGIKDRLPWVRRRRKKRSPRQTIHEHSSTGRR